MLPYLADRTALDDAAALIAEHGDDAAFAAAERADAGRDIGNYLSFCRWRQVERLVTLLAADHAVGTVH